jgi:uncharacterized membrane protein YeaQ/YmgE (transglycosylase-associated protein family)
MLAGWLAGCVMSHDDSIHDDSIVGIIRTVASVCLLSGLGVRLCCCMYVAVATLCVVVCVASHPFQE